MSEKVQEFKEKKLFLKIKMLEKKIEQNPKDSGLYLELGDLCVFSKNYKVYKKGFSAYKKAFSLNPSSQIATLIAQEYLEDENSVFAYRYGLKAIALEPSNLKLYLNLFETLDYHINLLSYHNYEPKGTSKKNEKIYKKLKKYQDVAIKVGEEFLKQNPNDYDVLCGLSDLYVQKDEDKALVYSQRAFEIDKKHDKAYYQLKYLYKTKEDYKKLLELYLTFGDYHEAGEIYRYRLRDFPEAIECYYKAIEVITRPHSEYYSYYESLGCTLNYIKEHEKALHYLQIAKKLDPDNGCAYINLVNVYNDLGNYEEVRKNLKIAYKISPDTPDILITKMEIDLILDNCIDTRLEENILFSLENEYFYDNKKVMGEYSMLKILFNITQNKDMKDELLKWKEEYERLPDSYSLVGLKNWAKKQDKDLQDRLLEALRVFK